MKRWLFTAIACAAAPAAATSVCTYEPLETGERDTVLSDAAHIGQLFDERNLRFRHAEIQHELDEFVGRLPLPAPDSYISYRAYLLDDPAPLSFSLPDGQIYLHTGLIARLESADQLAAILSHEAHHVAAHHQIVAAREGRRNRKTGNAGLYVLDAALFGGAMSTLGSAAEMRAQLQFADEEEAEADRCAVGLLEQASMPATAAVRVLDILATDTEFVAPRVPGSFTSPAALAARRDALVALVGQPPAETATDTRFAAIARAFQEKTIDDYLAMGAARTAVAFARGLVAIRGDAHSYTVLGDALHALGPHADTPPSLPSPSEARRLARMTQAEIDAELLDTEAGRSNQATNRGAALAAYQQALELSPKTARAHLGLGQLYFDEGLYRDAAGSLITYLKLEPDSPQKPLVLEKLQVIKNSLKQTKEQ